MEADKANAIIEKAIAATQSKIGYYADYDEDTEILTMVGWSMSAMANCKLITKPIVYPLDETGMWGDAVRERKAVITNDYKNLVKPTKKGYPTGHVEITRHLNIPIIRNGKVVGVLGVGNKDKEYTPDDVKKLEQAV
jgi:GAF domain-containing protein